MVEILKTRSRTEIVGLILQAVEAEPLTRSKIMYLAMLNFNQTNQYTALLVREGLLQYRTLENKYAINDKGRQFLALFNETNKLLNTPDGWSYNSSSIQFASPEPSPATPTTKVTHGATGGDIR